MKIFLRALAVFLAIGIVFAAIKLPYWVSAEENSETFADNPIIVNPVTEWESHSVASKSSQEMVAPLSWTDVKGLKLSAINEYTNDFPANSLAYARYKTDGDFVLGSAKYIIMYIKTDSANTVLPAVGYNGASVNASYDPLMCLGVGKTYSYLHIGGEEWTNSSTVATWKASSGDTDGDGISDTYFGGMKFEQTFEGFVRFAVSDLINDSSRINKLDRATTKISLFNLSVSRLGGAYGTVTAGPIFLTDSESDSVNILTPEIEAVPIKNYTVERSGAFGNAVYPIEDCSFGGESLDRNLEWDVSQTKFADITSCRLQFSNIGQTMKDTEGIMFYLSVPKATTTTFFTVLEDPKDSSRWRFSYLPSMLLLAEEEYYFLPEGDGAWKKGKLVYTNENGSKYRAGIYFEDGFTGYVKIPYSSLGNDSGYKFNANLDTINSLMFCFSRFGGDYGQVIAGPTFLVLNDGTIGEIKVHEDNKNTAFEIDAYRVDKGIEIGKVSSDVIVNKELKIRGTLIDNDTLLEYENNVEVGQQSRRFVNFNYSNESLQNTKGLLLYVKIPDANLIALNAVLEFPADKSRWNLSYAPVLSLYEGESCYVLPLGDKEWQAKTVVKASGNSYSGGIQFDSAFEGYIKIPYSALKNDSGLIFSTEKDLLNAITLRFKNVGGDYGEILVSETHLLKSDSTSYKTELVSKGKINTLISDSGEVIADKELAYFGDEVAVTVTAEQGYALKSDGLLIEYSDHSGYKKQIVSNFDSQKNAFVFKMPKADEISVKGEFVPASEQNFAVINPISIGDNSLQFTYREYQDAVSYDEKGVLIALKESLCDEELTINLKDTDIINATLSDPDNTFAFGDHCYSDYTVKIDGIKYSNLARNYIVRGYSAIDGVYFYTSPIAVNYNDAKGQFSDYESFSEIYSVGSYKNIVCSNVEMPFKELNFTDGIKAETEQICDFSVTEVQNSSYWFNVGFNPTAISEFNYIGIYVDVPTEKDNVLFLNFGDTNGVYYQIPAGKQYALINKVTGEKEYGFTLEGVNKNAGIISVPAGFKGLVCIPVSSLSPQNSIKPKTKLESITYRFGFMGSGENSVTVGAIVGFKQNSRAIKNSEILPFISSGTEDFVFESSLTEMLDDTAILYWENCDGAENYLIKAYKRVIGGFALVSENTLYSNSGSVSSLENGKEYFLTLSARDKRDNVLASYSAENFVFEVSKDYADIVPEEIVYDEVCFEDGNVKDSPFVKRSYTSLSAYNSELLNSNPNRGFRGCIDFFHFNLTEDAIKAEIERDIKSIKNNGFNSNTYVCYLYPGDYIAGDLGTEFFSSVQKIFDYFRENKIQILLRFAYFDVNNFNQRTPTTDEIIRHINQLSESGIIEQNKDVLHAFQVGFVGKYGEWHSDTPAETRADRDIVLNAFVEKLLPDGIYPQLRMPNFKDFLSAENLVKYGDRFGLHLDSFYGIMDGTELGSGQYSFGCTDWERHIKEAGTVPNDAETYYWQQFDDIGVYPEGYGSAIAASELRLTTFSAINGYLDQNANASGCLNEWKKLPVTENWLSYNNLPTTDGWIKDNNSKPVNRNVYEYMRDYVGYRLTAKELLVTESEKGMNISLDLVNYGFSAAFNITSNLVILDNQNNVMYSERVGNPEEWYGTNTGEIPSGELLVHKVVADMEIPNISGEYKIALRLTSKSGATARLDNNIPYEDGYNILHTFKVVD